MLPLKRHTLIKDNLNNEIYQVIWYIGTLNLEEKTSPDSYILRKKSDNLYIDISSLEISTKLKAEIFSIFGVPNLSLNESWKTSKYNY